MSHSGATVVKSRRRARTRSGGQGHSQEIVKLGVVHRPMTDLYVFLLTTPWSVLFALMLLFYVASNAAFALAYLLGGGIENARPGNFADAYFFSVQTMATIGYGKMTPSSAFANIVVSFEALFGIVAIAIATGLMFSKFSQPRARVIFSKYAVIGVRDGVQSLMLRLGNERKTGLVEAQLRLVLVRDETTQEGESVRRFHNLHLVRPSTAVFALSWTAIHPIDENSPLHRETPASLESAQADLVASLVGMEEATAQTVHARYAWKSHDILFGYRFVDIVRLLPDGRRALDYSRFDQVEPVAARR